MSKVETLRTSLIELEDYIFQFTSDIYKPLTKERCDKIKGLCYKVINQINSD